MGMGACQTVRSDRGPGTIQVVLCFEPQTSIMITLGDAELGSGSMVDANPQTLEVDVMSLAKPLIVATAQ